MKWAFNRNLIGCIFFVVFLFVLPRIFLGSDSYVVIHDNLDIGSAWSIRHIAKNDIYNPRSFLGNIMNGLPRPFLTTGSVVMLWFFLLFKPFTAYVINEILVHLFAFIGMYLLLKRHFLKLEEETFVALGVSLCFATLPFYSFFGLAVAGQPLLLYAFMNLTKERNNSLDFAIIFGFPFYAALAYSGFFVSLSSVFLFIYYCLKAKRIYRRFLLGLIILLAAQLFVEYDFIKSILFPGNVLLHKLEWNPAFLSYNFMEALKVGLFNFLYGQPDAPSKHLLIIITILFGIAATVFTNRKMSLKNSDRPIFILLFVTLAVSLFYSLYRWDSLVFLKEKISILRMIQLNRFYYLQPLLWYLIFALSLRFILGFKHGRLIVSSLVMMQLLFIFSSKAGSQNELAINYKILFEKSIGKENNRLTYKKFFSEALFDGIDDYINLPKDKYRVVGLGIHPSVLQYNGFFTLDSYQNVYPLAYKHRFREVIAKELDKSDQLKKYFDYWGNKCYVFVAELEDEGFMITKERNITIDNLELNTGALKNLGCKFIFSTVDILNARDNDLLLLRIFERNDSPWKIYLYRIESGNEKVHS